MAVTSINSVSSAQATNAGVTPRLPVQTLGQDDFLKLLVAQLSAQDPLNPQKDTEFIAQMAQFSALEQTKAMQSDISGLRHDQRMVQAQSLIGRNVALLESSGAVVTGVVSAVTVTDNTPQLLVNGKPFSLDTLVGVTPTTP